MTYARIPGISIRQYTTNKLVKCKPNVDNSKRLPVSQKK